MADVLTDSKLKMYLKGHDGKYPVKIKDLDGLSVLARPTGKVTFTLRYSFDGKQKELALGAFTGKPHGMTLKDARDKARECQRWLEEGRDPALVMKLAKNELLKPVTVRDALEYWLNNHAEKKRTNAEKHRQQFAKWVYPRIGDLPLSECETRHWLSVFDEYRAKAPVASGYCFQNCKQAIKYCRVRNYASSKALDDLTVNAVGEKQTAKTRVLTLDELRDVLAWCDNERNNQYYRHLLRLLVIFGARTQEIRFATVDEFDLTTGIWTVPIEHSKTAKPITRAIPDTARGLIGFLISEARKQGTDLLLWEVKKPEAVSQWGRMLWKRLGHTKPWGLHDLRRSMATHLSGDGQPPYIIELILGHSLGGVMKHYIHNQRVPEQLTTLNRWAEILHQICLVKK